MLVFSTPLVNQHPSNLLTLLIYPPPPLPCVNKYRGTCIHTVCDRGGWSGPQADKHLPPSTLTDSIFKKSRHLGFGVFIDIWSMPAPKQGPEVEIYIISIQYNTLLRIRDVYPRSQIRLFSRPGSRIRIFLSRIRIEEIKYFKPKNSLSSRKYDPDCSLRIQNPDPYFSPIQDPEVKKALDPGSGSILVQSCIVLA